MFSVVEIGRYTRRSARSSRVWLGLLNPCQFRPFAVQELFGKQDVGGLVELSVYCQVFDYAIVCYRYSKHWVCEVTVSA